MANLRFALAAALVASVYLGDAPHGLGTHRCLGSRWMDLRLAVNVMIIAHHFTFEMSPADWKLKFSPLPSMKSSEKLRFRVAEQRRDLPA